MLHYQLHYLFSLLLLSPFSSILSLPTPQISVRDIDFKFSINSLSLSYSSTNPLPSSFHLNVSLPLPPSSSPSSLSRDISCKSTWEPPFYPQGWISCDQNEHSSLFFRFFDTQSTPTTKFGLALMDMSYSPTSGLIVQESQITLEKDTMVSPTHLYTCDNPNETGIVKCQLADQSSPNTSSGSISPLLLDASDKSISLNDGFIISRMKLFNESIPAGGSMCRISLTIQDSIIGSLPLHSQSRNDGGDLTELTCSGSWICSSDYFGLPQTHFGFANAACNAPNMFIKLNSPNPGLDQINLEISRKLFILPELADSATWPSEYSSPPTYYSRSNLMTRQVDESNESRSILLEVGSNITLTYPKDYSTDISSSPPDNSAASGLELASTHSIPSIITYTKLSDGVLTCPERQHLGCPLDKVAASCWKQLDNTYRCPTLPKGM